jgi:hypothetical protein
VGTFRLPILGPNTLPGATVFPDRVGNQITAATAPSVGSQLCFVMNDAGADEGLYGDFLVPKNYVGSPKIVAKGILDGAPGASDTVGSGFRKRAVANNESADGTFDAEQTVSSTVGSGGSGHSDEDQLELSITLTAGGYSVDDVVHFYFYIDTSGMTYAGNFLLTG